MANCHKQRVRVISMDFPVLPLGLALLEISRPRNGHATATQRPSGLPGGDPNPEPQRRRPLLRLPWTHRLLPGGHFSERAGMFSGKAHGFHDIHTICYIYIYQYDKYDSHGFNSEGNHEPHDSFRNGNVTLMGKHESFSIIRPMKALSIQSRSTVVSPIPQTPGFWMVQEKTIETSQQWHTWCW